MPCRGRAGDVPSDVLMWHGRVLGSFKTHGKLGCSLKDAHGASPSGKEWRCMGGRHAVALRGRHDKSELSSLAQ